MSFFVLDANPVQSANRLCWLDCESAAFEGARIIVSAFKHHGGQIEDIDFEPLDNHPLVRFAIISADNARWMMRYTRAATIKWGEGENFEIKGYKEIMEKMNKVASRIDGIIPHGQRTLFGNFYVDEKSAVILSQDSIESNRAYYERTRKHLSWGDHEPALYGGEQE
tara:strand:- start:2736 stop:3236 length:501 start_codon:yes stop_codon:yes gene_type:complete